MTDVTVVVSVSGGKDSAVVADLALQTAGPDRVRLVTADTGHEHELTYGYIDYLRGRFNVPIDVVRADFSQKIANKRIYVAETWPEKGVAQEFIDRALKVLHPTGVPFLDLCLWKGRFPSRMAQFCTQELKRYPMESYMLDLMAAGHKLESWQGVRRDESQARAHVLKVERAAEGWLIRRPIATWSAAMVFRYHRRRGIEPNPLYKLGMKRVGCMPCINCGKDELAEIAARFPQHIDKIREWEALVCDAAKRGYSSFFCDGVEDGTTPAEAFEAFRIDNRVAWAKTTRGGKQFDLMKAGAPAVCSSSYGLCE